MLTPEQILEIARAHCFYPDADLTALVRTIEKTAETAAIERCAKIVDGYIGSEPIANDIRALLPKEGRDES